MTVRKIHSKISKRSSPAELNGNNTALTFVINSEFIDGLKVLIYSMAVHETLMDLPIFIISEDKEVFSDPFIMEVADKTYLASQEDIMSFSNISNKKVEGKLKLDWIPKYTYMKWLMFDDWGYDSLIFIDADIVCLSNCDELLQKVNADLYGCPVFGRELVIKVDDKIDVEDTDLSISKFAYQNDPPGSRLNTGVLVVNKKLLNSEFRRDLITFTENGEYSVEQAALRTYIGGTPGLSMKLMSPMYNYKHDFVSRLSAAFQPRILTDIKFLHFAGSAGKPWEKAVPETLSDWIWRSYADDAARRLPGLINLNLPSPG